MHLRKGQPFLVRCDFPTYEVERFDVEPSMGVELLFFVGGKTLCSATMKEPGSLCTTPVIGVTKSHEGI